MAQMGEREKALRAAREAQVSAAAPAKPKGKLNARERDRLTGCELVIERGLRTFIEVGEALATIREDELYRETHGTWDAYCRGRWKMSDRRARQLMAGAEIAGQIGTRVPVPASEKQVRPLGKLPPDRRPEAWESATAAAGGQPKPRHVEAAVQLVLGSDKAAPEPAATPEPRQEPPQPLPERPEAELRRLRALMAAVRTALDVETDAEVLSAIVKLRQR